MPKKNKISPPVPLENSNYVNMKNYRFDETIVILKMLYAEECRSFGIPGKKISKLREASKNAEGCRSFDTFSISKLRGDPCLRNIILLRELGFPVCNVQIPAFKVR